MIGELNCLFARSTYLTLASQPPEIFCSPLIERNIVRVHSRKTLAQAGNGDDVGRLVFELEKGHRRILGTVKFFGQKRDT